VIGANSVVTRSVPPYSVVAGNPARVVRQFDSQERKWVRVSPALTGKS
jgi:acetyltransferase-like isoleucine patch superfamily enzyme